MEANFRMVQFRATHPNSGHKAFEKKNYVISNFVYNARFRCIGYVRHHFLTVRVLALGDNKNVFTVKPRN